MTDRPLKQIHLAAHFPGVNNTTVWSDPASGSHIEFDSFRHLAQTAERGKFDFLFLAEGLRLRETKGRIHDLDVVGRPESITVLNALAAVTERLGLAATADVVFSRHSTFADGQAFHADVKRRLAAYGRKPDELKIMPAATFVLGDTDADAAERAAEIRRAQVGPQTTLNVLEQVWGVDLSDHDPDGPLPAVAPVPDSALVQGRVRIPDPLGTAERWRALAAEKGLSSRELVIEVTGRQSFIGSPATVAGQIDHFVQQDAADGFILVPHLTPGGLDEFVDRVVPLLQERGVFRTDYTGPTLRDHLGLPVPGRR
ncbi:LLM class flavin-dependent oxidoreductase [Kitasatospora sp. NPDC018058]|uniref:LLM class flavin-dependent oxidoreductase n=1 Tax=Kitasatospora sp. NPDC018058 TaxID=3364025 RepID=UPI0037C09308